MNNVNGTDDVDDLSVAFGIVAVDIVRIVSVVAVVVVVVVCASANVGIFILLEFLMLVVIRGRFVFAQIFINIFLSNRRKYRASAISI